MATTRVDLPQTSRFSEILGELELTWPALAVLLLGWAGVWAAWAAVRFNWLAAVSATACWLSLVVTWHAWSDLVLFGRRWRAGDYHSSQMRARPHWWLAPIALVAGIVLARLLW
jgi:hypothetical protein